jgi:N-acetylmuramoyl-L-alanine amidase
MASKSLWQIPCKQGPRAANDSGARKATSIRLIVIHSAEAADSFGGDTSAEGVANYFSRSSTKASTQLAVDRDSCVRMLPDLVIPWGAKGANSDGLHVENCGYAKWTKAEWLKRTTLLRRSAAKCAMWAWRYNIPCRWLSVAQVKAGRAKGFTTHKDVNDAFKGGSHWDPGPGFPRTEFMEWVRGYYKEIKEART